MNKNLIFGGLALAILSGGAYFYFKNKNKKTLTQKLNQTLGTNQGVSSLVSTNTTSGNPSQTNTGTNTTSNTSPTGTIATNDNVLYTAPLSTAPTQAEIEAKAKSIADAKNKALKICDLKSKRANLLNISDYEYIKLYPNYQIFANNSQMLSLLKKSSIDDNDKQISDLNNKLALLGYLETNCDITRINV